MRRPALSSSRSPPQVFGSQVQEVIQLGTGSYWSNQEYYNTQVDILRGYDLSRITVEHNRLHRDKRLLSEADQEGRSEEELIKRATAIFHGALSASQHRESRVVSVHIRHTNRALAVELANMHVETFIEYTRGLRSRGSGKVSQFLADELDVATKRLRDSEEQLFQFEKDNNILSVEEKNKLERDLERYSEQHREARIKRMQLQTEVRQARRFKDEDVLASPVFALARAGGVVETLRDQYAQAKHALDEIAGEHGPKHPIYINQKQKLDSLHADLRREAKRVVREVDLKYRTARANEAQFAGEVEALRKRKFELKEKMGKYNDYKRQHKSNEENHNLMLGRLRTSEVSGRNREVNIRPHESARLAVLVHPRMKLNVAVSAVFSLLLAIGLAFMLEFLDRTVKTAEEIESVVGSPVLGIIPILDEVAGGHSPAENRDRDMWVFEHPTSRAAECCRSIRTNILFSSADRPMKTITISSPRPREGKTTSTIFLGTTMAQSGQRVLVIDTDLRKPRLHHSLGASRTRGITNLILGDCSVDDAIKTTDVPNLYVLPCGPQPPNPAELLLTDRFREVLQDLESRFDRILLDSPPLLAVTDGVVLSRIADGVILVTQAGKTLLDDAVQCARQLRDVNAPLLGVVLNDMDLSDSRYGYYYYQYSYGDAKQEPAASKAG